MLSLYLDPNEIEAGCDEAGRGCLSGPVYAAAVILPQNFSCPELNDSKQLSEQQRERLRPFIEQNALSWAVAKVDAPEIDQINILQASFLAMHRAVDTLSTRPTSLLIDGNRFKAYAGIPHHCIIKGDGKFMAIAAASVLAKTYRDEWMKNLDTQFPMYGWKQNKGYPTKAHREAIRIHGPTAYHRQSFRLLVE